MSSKQPVLYLSFDDGPKPEVSTKLLALLAQHQIQATFFVIGNKLQNNLDIAHDIIGGGHSLANHSYSHPEFSTLSHAQQVQQWQDCESVMKKANLPSANAFRAPRGRWNLKLLWTLSRKQTRAMHWSRDSMDYTHQQASSIVRGFVDKPVRNGDIILFHDDNGLCIEALETLIPKWKQAGFRFEGLTRPTSGHNDKDVKV